MTLDQRTCLAWIAVGWAIGIAWFAIDAQKPPVAVPFGAPTDVFAAGRAQKHVEDIARASHPMGSAEAERVRHRLAQKLKDFDLVPEISAPRRADSLVRNVVARLRGQGPTDKKTLMLCAHYDSVANSPGAGDDASGVAVVLETVRALKASAPIKRDVVVLFTDGEENGLDGSRLFVDEHPWAKDVGVVLNFDARGNSGPSIMFETSEPNGWLIDQYAQAAPHPLATSLSMDIYRRMPNSTDLTTFKGAGMGGMNFAFSAGIAYYHSPKDTPVNLDPRTLQHQGENALAMTRQLGQLDLDNPKRDDVIYTSILSRFVVYYSKAWVLPLALIATGLFMVVVLISTRAGLMRLTDLAATVGVLIAAMWISLLTIGILCIVGIFWSVLRDPFHGVPIPWQNYDVTLVAGCMLVTATITLSLVGWSGRHRPLIALCLGAFFWWLILSLGTALWLPGASYLFVWPTLAGLFGVGINVQARPGSVFALLITLLCSIPSLLLLPPLIRTTFDALSLDTAAPIVMILVVLFIGTTLPLLGPLVARDISPWKRTFNS